MGERISQWYKEAIIYELHVKCFFDSAGQGWGDFNGLTQKLDYLQDLGVTAIWLIPFYPSPLKDDGYDISDYTSVNPQFGDMRDFKRFLREAHRRGLRVITELVINHTSDQHPWFQRARHAEAGSRYRNYYVWNETPDLYKDARIIFQDYESSNWTWDPVANSYFWHRFYSHQPDLNFDNPEVRKELFRFMDFWFNLGVDGLRLDAIPYLYERDGTTCENLPETHAFLKELRAHVDTHFSDRMLLAEANQWPEDAAKYFGEGDECHMAFHFPVMPRLFMSIHLEDSLPIIEIMGQTPAIPDNSQWALFLRNHDELTLEMVTDEERDYMFRVYAHDPQARINLGIRRRLAPLLRNDRRQIELMNTLLFSLTGTPVIYYGDELGMGDNIYLGDRDGVRTPMQWSSDRNAGFSRANPQQLYLPPIIDPEYHYETVNVEAQQNNSTSLLWWTKQLIALRKHYKALSYGATEFLLVDNRKVLVFFREYEDELLMIITNLSRHAQYVELDLHKYDGYSLIEMFSGERFPQIGELPYFLTLSPYAYYWFSLEKMPEETQIEQKLRKKEQQFPTITLHKESEKLFSGSLRRLEEMIGKYLKRRLWFHPLLPKLEQMNVIDQVMLADDTHCIFIQLKLSNALTQTLPLFLRIFRGDEVEERQEAYPENVVVKIEGEIIYDVSGDQDLGDFFLEMISKQQKIRTEAGELRARALPPTHVFPEFLAIGSDRPTIFREQDRLSFPHEKGVIRLFWLLDEGVNLDVEIRLFLTQKTQFRNFLPIMGYLEYSRPRKADCVLAEEIGSLCRDFNAKQVAIESADRFLMRAEAQGEEMPAEVIKPPATWLELAAGDLHPKMHTLLEEHVEVARHLGEVTAQFHEALLSQPLDPDYSSIPFNLFYQRSLYQTLRRKMVTAVGLLKQAGCSECHDVASHVDLYLQNLTQLPHIKLTASRCRHHGNYLLENLHYTGREFLIANFQGNPAYPYTERRYKRSPLRDVASMLYSFAEASYLAMEKVEKRGFTHERGSEVLHNWAYTWSQWIGSAFLRAYFANSKQLTFLPETTQEIDFLLGLLLLERSVETVLAGEITIPVWIMHHWLPIYNHVQPL